MVRDSDLTRGGEHTTQGTDNVLWNCAPQTCIILLTSVTPINSIKRKKSFSLKNPQFILINISFYSLITFCPQISYPMGTGHC